MQSFIVLGIIPGTHIQTTFNFWLIVALVFSLLAFSARLYMAALQLRRYLALRKIAWTIAHTPFGFAV